jgi:hypothetical protein
MTEHGLRLILWMSYILVRQSGRAPCNGGMHTCG